MKIITYATHAEGTFDTLVNSGHNIKVIGWGTKWNGFMDKFKGVLSYLETRADDEIIVFVDGFDSLINKKNLDGLEQDFINMDCKVLYSLEDKSGASSKVPNFLLEYFNYKVYGTCKNNQIANTGLYMGYCKELKIVLKAILSADIDDDQRAVNSLCSQFPFLKIDTQNIIFENCSSTTTDKSNSYFISSPGTMSFNRCIIRGIPEYSKYFIPEIILLILLIFFIIYKW
jgi:hypothetical protein